MCFEFEIPNKAKYKNKRLKIIQQFSNAVLKRLCENSTLSFSLSLSLGVQRAEGGFGNRFSRQIGQDLKNR